MIILYSTIVAVSVSIFLFLILIFIEQKRLFSTQELIKFEKEKLLISLNHTFYSDKEFQHLLDGVDRGIDLTSEDLSIASRYLDFFEPFYYLLSHGEIDLEQADSMFAYRFFVVVNDKDVQDYLIAQHPAYYTNIYQLYSLWRTYRIENGNTALPQEENDLLKSDWYISYTEKRI